MAKLATTALTFVALLSTGLSYNTNDQILNGDLDYGTFANPSVHVRPRFRYWIPDASVNLTDVAADFARAKQVGMGGFELLGYYLYGDFPRYIAEGGPTPTDWTIYGWGTPAWKELQDTCLQATKEQGLIMDFSLGPNQGSGVPANQDDEGIMWDLIPFNVSVPVGGSFNGILPGWGKVPGGQFVSASTGLVTQIQSANYSATPSWIGPYYYNGSQVTLATSSLQDVTGQIDNNGRLSIGFPANATGIEYRIFAFYQNHSTYHEQAPPWYVNTTVPQSPITNYVQNGSWLVDHFSPDGAQLIINFWEQELLGNGSKQMIQDIGNYAWEDSQEFGQGALVWWTPQLLNTFQTNTGYALNKYLPLIYSLNNEAPAPLASPDHFYTDEDDQGWAHVNDYWQTITKLNQIYLQTLSNWAVDSLQSQFSAQVVYNLPMDMLANVPHVNAPECESLGFNHLIDGYRQYAGPANLAGKRIVSSELGAQRNEVYSQTLPELIWDVKRSIVGSVNQFVYHGFPYSGSYPNTTWPGFTTFTYRFSNMHGPRQPAWQYYNDYMNWTARMQYVAQSGVPKIDLAFWLKLDQYYHVNSQYEPNDLQQAGYTYEYLSPDNFDLPEAYVANKTLAPNRQAFKALVLRANDTLTVPGVEKVVEFAHEGLPIIFSGGLPQNLTGFNVSATEYVRSALASLVSLDNVHIVPYDNLAASLQALGFAPRTAVRAGRIWYTYWREDVDASLTYTFIYNDAYDSVFGEGASTGSVTFAATGVPYIYNAWTGDVEPILAFQQTSTTTTIPLTVAGNQSAIIAFHHNETARAGTRLLSLPSAVYSASARPGYGGNQIMLKAGNTTEPILLSNGTTVILPVPARPTDLTNWALTVESWSPPSDLYADQTQPSMANSTYNITSLQPWYNISDSLRNVSGRGFYSTTFTWPPSNDRADGAMVSLGAIVHTARVWVNGHQLPPLDPTAAIADIGAYLVQGTNTVEVTVSTTLGNVLRPIYHNIRSSGTSWLGPQPDEQAYGLLHPVMLVPYCTTIISL